MKEWELELEEDRLGNSAGLFFELSERVQAYRTYYFSGKKQEPDEEASQQAAAPAAIDRRRTDTPVSTLLTLYDEGGTECTFSRKGMRQVQRRLPWQGHYHTHESVEFLFVLEGSFQQILLGERQTFHAGEVVLTDQNVAHADCLEGGGSVSLLFLAIHHAYLDQLLASCDVGDDLGRFFFHALQRHRKEQAYLRMCPAAQSAGESGQTGAGQSFAQEMRVLLENLLREDWHPAQGTEDIVRGCLKRLLFLLCRDYSVQLHSLEQADREKAFLYELERYIRLRNGCVSSAELEKVFHYHRNYYNLLLQKYRQVSLRAYTTELRLRRAAVLLRETGMPIREAARSCGWNNNSHFYHLFEERFQCSPGEYREQKTHLWECDAGADLCEKCNIFGKHSGE